MPENWLGLVNNSIYYAHQTCEIYFFEIHWVKQPLVNVVLFGMMDL